MFDNRDIVTTWTHVDDTYKEGDDFFIEPFDAVVNLIQCVGYISETEQLTAINAIRRIESSIGVMPPMQYNLGGNRNLGKLITASYPWHSSSDQVVFEEGKAIEFNPWEVLSVSVSDYIDSIRARHTKEVALEMISEDWLGQLEDIEEAFMEVCRIALNADTNSELIDIDQAVERGVEHLIEIIEDAYDSGSLDMAMDLDAELSEQQEKEISLRMKLRLINWLSEGRLI